MEPNYYVQPSSQSSGAKFLAGKGKFLIIGLVIAVVVGIVLMLVSGNNQSNTQSSAVLSTKLTSILSLLNSTTITRNIKNAELNQLTLDYGLTLQTDLNDISETPVSAATVTPESAIGKKLNEAYLNNNLDQAFAEELTSQVASAKITTAALYGKASNETSQKKLKSVNDHLTEMETKISKMNL